MKKICALIIVSLLASTSYADFPYMQSGARPVGMAGAFIAVADDINAFFYNPAGLQAIQRLEAMAMYGKLYWGLSDESNLYEGTAALAYSIPVYGTVALGWTGRGLSDFYQEDAFKVGYSAKVPRGWVQAVKLKFLSNVSFGINANMYMVHLAENDYTRLSSSIAKLSTTGFSLDAGLLVKIGEFKAAVVAKDIMEPDLTLTAADKNVLPMEISAGISYRWVEFGKLLATVEVISRVQDYKARAGLEKWFFENQLGCRAGFGYGRDQGADYASDASVGFSYILKTASNMPGLDYAFTYPLNGGIENTWGRHFFSIFVKW
jgi:hypothetical protein